MIFFWNVQFYTRSIFIKITTRYLEFSAGVAAKFSRSFYFRIKFESISFLNGILIYADG